MEELHIYREWLRARGIEDPSNEDVTDFQSRAKRNPRSSVVEFLLYIWMDSRRHYAGTRRWLELQGLTNPTAEELAYFSAKIKRTAGWRASVVLALVAGWFVFVAEEGLKLGALGMVFPIGVLAYGITHVFGTKLPGHGPREPALRNARHHE